VLSARQ